MSYSDMLIIQNGAKDSLLGVLIIITLVSIIYTFVFIELSKKKISKLNKAKKIIIDSLNEASSERINEG